MRKNRENSSVDNYTYRSTIEGANVSTQQLTIAACAVARLCLHLIPVGDTRPRVAIETAEAWAKGEANEGQVENDRYAAYIAAYIAACDANKLCQSDSHTGAAYYAAYYATTTDGSQKQEKVYCTAVQTRKAGISDGLIITALLNHLYPAVSVSPKVVSNKSNKFNITLNLTLSEIVALQNILIGQKSDKQADLAKHLAAALESL